MQFGGYTAHQFFNSAVIYRHTSGDLFISHHAAFSGLSACQFRGEISETRPRGRGGARYEPARPNPI